MKIFVCEEHLELGIDIFVDEAERAPSIVDLQAEKAAEGEIPSRCLRCEQPPRYKLA